MMVINILAGGPDELLPQLTDFSGENTVWVGVDRGVYHLLSRNIVPVMGFGDFDSVSEVELALIESKIGQLNRFKPEKDETDTELALNWAIEQNPAEIRLFGATGGRIDHLLANVQLLIKPLSLGSSTRISIVDKKNIVYLAGPGTHTIKKIPEKKYISFVPLTLDVTNLTLEGFKFPLENRHISIGSTLCISNELINQYGTFSFSEGILIVIRSHD